MWSGSFLVDAVALLATATAIVYAYYKWSYSYWKRKGVPYLEPSFPFGNMPNPVTSDVSQGDKFLSLYKEAKSKGWKQCGIYAGTLPVYLLLDLELLKNVMTKDFQNFTERGLYINEKDDPLSLHLFNLGGSRWKNLRVKLTPTFTSGKMKMMFQIMADCGKMLEDYITDYVVGKEVLNVKDLLGRFSTDIIGSCAFGLDCNSFEEPNSPFRVHGKRAVDATTIDIIKMSFALSFPNVAKSLKIRQFSKEMYDFYSKVVEDTMAYRKKNHIVRNDFFQMLMEMRSQDEKIHEDANKNTLTMHEIIAQCFVFFIAGFETSSTTMAFALFELSRNQPIQDKVRKEIHEVLAKHDGQVTYDAMNELIYMKQVIDETLRKYPPVPVVSRQSLNDYPIPKYDMVLEKGTQVLIPIVGLHYDEEYYKNPEVFDPERFNSENRSNIPQYAFLPFGEGPRVCIGERFGIMQTKVGLTSVLRKFKVTLNEKTRVPLKMDPQSLVSSAVGGIWLNVARA